MRDFLKNSTDPCEAIESWNGSLAQFLDEQEAKQKWRHYPTVTTLPHLTVYVTGTGAYQLISTGFQCWILDFYWKVAGTLYNQYLFGRYVGYIRLWNMFFLTHLLYVRGESQLTYPNVQVPRESWNNIYFYFQVGCVESRVSDPYLFQCGSGFSILGQCGSRCGCGPGFSWPKFRKIYNWKKFMVFDQKLQFSYP